MHTSPPVQVPGRTALARALSTALVCLTATWLPGCLSNSYVIQPAEIERLERTPAAQRGRNVRVVQRFSTADDPKPAAPWPAPQPMPMGAPPTQARGGVAPMWTQVWLSPTAPPTFRPRLSGVGVRSSVAGSGGSGVIAGRSTTPRSTGGGGPSSASSSGGDGKALLVAAVLAGVAIGVGLAVTEGARYDGWATLHPQHPVHVMGPNGERVVPLDQLTLRSVGPDEEAVVVRHEGAGMWLLGRAPLDRAGFTYSFDLGRSGIPLLDGRVGVLTGGAIRMGAFANSWLGVLGGVDIAMGAVDGNGASAVTPHIQVILAPIRLWRLHLGGFGEVGWSSVDLEVASGDDEPSGVRYAAGVLMQWEITTRLALDFRWTWRWLQRSGTEPSGAITTGLSIY